VTVEPVPTRRCCVQADVGRGERSAGRDVVGLEQQVRVVADVGHAQGGGGAVGSEVEVSGLKPTTTPWNTSPVAPWMTSCMTTPLTVWEVVCPVTRSPMKVAVALEAGIE
jgi:hypothetical protein